MGTRITHCRPWIALLALALLTSSAQALDYLDNDSLRRALQGLADNHEDLIRVNAVARSLGRADVWHVEVGSGTDTERANQPAILVVAGIEGDDLAGTSILVHWLEKLATQHQSDTAISGMLATTTWHVFPRLDPDGASRYFTRPQHHASVNLEPVDEDHDGLIDEDPPDDLNGDGLITSMRVRDPAGDYILDPVDDRLLARADPLKGELGAWRLLLEGRDDDQDEAWNEDGAGGVNLNRNFPYNYSYFESWAGRHPVSQTETRYLAEFFVNHPNIAIAFTFGAADNLSQPPKSEAPKRPPVTIHPDDIGFYRVLGQAWREGLGLKKELSGATHPGTFSDWVYFHRGRLSLAARPWSPALQLQRVPSKPKPDEKKETSEPEKTESDASEKKPDEKKPDDPKEPQDKRNEEERNFLNWLVEKAPASFVPWQPYNHPEFPGQKVEIGGFAPYARVAPPAELLAELADAHAIFLNSLPSRLPKLGLRRSRLRALGDDVYDITLEIENTGFLPTSLAQGETTTEVNPTRLLLDLDPANFISGSPRTMLGAIAGSGGAREVRFVIHAPGRQQITVRVISALAGTFEHTLRLTSP